MWMLTAPTPSSTRRRPTRNPKTELRKTPACSRTVPKTQPRELTSAGKLPRQPFSRFISDLCIRDDDRVIRSCGWIPDDKGRDCYTTVFEEYNTLVCACKEEGCNGAN